MNMVESYRAGPLIVWISEPIQNHTVFSLSDGIALH